MDNLFSKLEEGTSLLAAQERTTSKPLEEVFKQCNYGSSSRALNDDEATIDEGTVQELAGKDILSLPERDDSISEQVNMRILTRG